MAVLVDTGVLLRLINEADAHHDLVVRALDALVKQGERLVTTVQNIAEYLNVATRPAELNGLGRSPVETLTSLAESIEPACTVLGEQVDHYDEFKRLLTTYEVRGKQVHDVRLVASMATWKITKILTLNERHFLRFTTEGITVLTPEAVLSRQDEG